MPLGCEGYVSTLARFGKGHGAGFGGFYPAERALSQAKSLPAGDGKFGGDLVAESFDFIVVGGGSGGCAVAGRLSEDAGTSVALLEAGGSNENWVVTTPGALVLMVAGKLNNWALETVPQAGLNGRTGYQPRSKGLGGSSAINAMVYIRGHRSDYDGWAAQGNTGWAYDDVLPFFKKSENNEVIQDGFHGAGGPLNVASIRTSNPFQDYFLEAR